MILEEVIIHDTLNPAIWNENNSLKDDVRDAVIEVANAFLADLEIPIIPVDIVLLGSNASYNYTEKSDLDIHIIANYELLDASPIVVQAMFNAARSSFNKDYNIKIKGINAEIYVEDINTATISNGIYSVIRDEWIKMPQKITVSDVDLEPELSEITDQVTEALTTNDLSVIEDTINALYLMRKNSIASDGEFGRGNLIFKEIRNLGLLDDLKSLRLQLKSQELSLESKSITEGWYDSKREVWRELREYYDLLMNENRWEYLDEFTSLYSHYENDLDGKLGYSKTSNPYGNEIRRLYIVGCMVPSDGISELKSGSKTIYDFDEDKLL